MNTRFKKTLNSRTATRWAAPLLKTIVLLSLLIWCAAAWGQTYNPCLTGHCQNCGCMTGITTQLLCSYLACGNNMDCVPAACNCSGILGGNPCPIGQGCTCAENSWSCTG